MTICKLQLVLLFREDTEAVKFTFNDQGLTQAKALVGSGYDPFGHDPKGICKTVFGLPYEVVREQVELWKLETKPYVGIVPYGEHYVDKKFEHKPK